MSKEAELIIEELAEFDGQEGLSIMTESEKEEEEKEEEEKEEEEKEEEKEEGEVEGKEEESKKEPEPEPEPEPEKKSEDRYTQLMAEIDRLQGMVKSKDSGSKEPAKSSEDPADFLQDLSIDELLSDSGKMNSVFHQIAKYAVKEALENMNISMPSMINSQVDDLLAVRDITSNFYKANEDLSNVRNVVKTCAEQVATEHSDWSVDQVLEESAKRTRQSLGLPDPASRSNMPSADKAGFAGGSKSKRTKTQKISALQQELDEL